MKIYIVASDTKFTVITMAKNKSDALKNARLEYWDSHGFLPETSNNDFVVYDAREYLKTENLVIWED